MGDYIRKLRTKVGQDKIIHPGARIIVENEKGEILFVEKAPNGKVGLPAGALEEGETIEACMIREVWEETGIELLGLKVIGISSSPTTETISYPNGDVIQYFVIEFYSNEWRGPIRIHDKKEILKASFQPPAFLKKLPLNEQSIIDSWHYYKANAEIQLK